MSAVPIIIYSPPQIRQSVEQLGFKWSNTKILLSSQAHYDHVAGAAQVLRGMEVLEMARTGASRRAAAELTRDAAFRRAGNGKALPRT